MFSLILLLIQHMAYGNTECCLLERTRRSRSKKLHVTLSCLRNSSYCRKYVIVLAVHSCSIFPILSVHSKKRLLLREVLFSASCNLARSKLIFINTFIYLSSFRAILLKINFLAKQLQNCSYLKAYICTHIHIYICFFTQSRSKIALSSATVTSVQQVKISGRNIC